MPAADVAVVVSQAIYVDWLAEATRSEKAAADGSRIKQQNGTHP